MSGSFVQRAITVKLELGTGDYGESGFDVVTFTDYRMSAKILKVGSGGYNAAEIRIYGAPVDIMNRVNSHGVPYPLTAVKRNYVSVSAGDEVSGLAEVFRGTIQMAWADFDETPSSALVITAFAGLFENMKPVPPISFSGSANVATIMSTLADVMNLQFENNGVSVILSNPYLPGTARQQVAEAARAADINWTIDKRTLAIWPKDGKRGGSVPLYSPDHGMIGYPTYTSPGLDFRAIFTPGRDPEVGGLVEVQSSLNPASGKWLAFRVLYSLDARMPGGKWEMQVSCFLLPGSGGYTA